MVLLNCNSKKANAIATFIVLTIIFISGISLFVMYQVLVIESQQDLQERQQELITATQTNFKIENASYDDSFNQVTFTLTNTGNADLDTRKLTFFVDDDFGTNPILTLLDSISKNTQLLQPNSKMRVTFDITIAQEAEPTLKTVHDLGLRAFAQVTLPYYIGEAGSFSVQNNQNIIINFTRTTYTQPPALFMTTKTDNAGVEVPFAPIIHSINTTHANVSLCRDNGAATCDLTYGLEEVTYMAFDVDRTNNLSWAEIGFVDAPTNGATTSFSFTNSFSNTPYIFGQPQTYNIGGVVSNGIGAHSWFPSITTTGADIVGCDHPGIANDCAGTATEQFAYLAIDPVNIDMETAEMGSVNIADSLFTPISFTQPYTNPQILVMQNSEGGIQDPAYPWARLVSSTGAEVRYCEADTAGVCDGHATEVVRWLSIEDGPIEVIQ